MKIKRKVEMNLPQLIEWGWKNEIEKRSFTSNGGKVTANFEDMGRFVADNFISSDVTFTVEIEEKITEKTKLWNFIELSSEGLLGRTYLHKNLAIEDVKTDNSVAFYIIDDDLTPTLIWTKEKGLL